MDKHSIAKDKEAIAAYEKAMSKKSTTTKPKKEKTMKTKKAHKTEKKEKKAKKTITKKSSSKKEKKQKKVKKDRVHRGSKTGKFKNIRNMMEVMFAKNKDLTKEEANKAILKEFPNSGWAKRIKLGFGHFPAYKTRIVSHCVFKTINPPAWAKKTRAKIK